MRVLALMTLGFATLFAPRVTLPEPPDSFEVGVLYWTSELPSHLAMRRGLETEVRRLNAREETAVQFNAEARVAGHGEKGLERQIEEMNELIDLGVDLILVQPASDTSLVEPLERPNRLETPVIAFDPYISRGVLDCYVTSDNYRAGCYDGESIASLFEDDRSIQLVLVEYASVSSAVQRANGFLGAFKKLKQPHEVLAHHQAFDANAGKKACQAILEAYPVRGSVDVVFTVNGTCGATVVGELAEAERNEILVASIGGNPESLRNVESGRLAGIDTVEFCGARLNS